MEIEKSVLIINYTSDAKVTLFIYSAHDPLCWLSSSSKVIEPGKKYLYRSNGSFKFELRAHGEKSKRKIMQPVKEWETPAACIVTGCVEDSSVKVEEKSLTDFPQENRICIRRQNMEKEISVDCGRNLYEILKLNIKDVRKEETEEQNKMIKEAYHREMRRWHPDRQQGPVDGNICQEIIMAYSVLRDPEKRAKYNNAADYNNGWMSISRWKSIFWPDCNSEEQVYQYRKRMALMALSAGILVGGIALTIFTAGLAAPVVIGCTVASGAMIGGGIQSSLRAVSRGSIENGCDTKKYLTSMVIGGVAGALIGGAAAGITAAMVGIGSAALQATEVTMGQYIAAGSATGAAGGAVSSVAADVERKIVDGEDISVKKMLVHATLGVVIGAAAGVAGGAVTKAAVGPAVSASATNIEGEAVEQLAIRCAAKKGAKGLAKHATRFGSLVEDVTGGALEITATVTEDRMDYSVENTSLGEHGFGAIPKLLKTAAINSVKAVGREISDARPGNGTDPKTNNNFEQFEVEEDEGKINLTKTRKTFPKEKCQKPESKKKCEVPGPPSVQIGCNIVQKEQYYQDVDNSDTDEAKSENDGRIRYISDGAWISKLIVQYTNDENEVVKKEESGSGSSIEIPENAKDVEVRFQVLRFIGTWCDVKKYDRFDECWSEPAEPHIFKYKQPPIRTFTISGGLYYEAVMKVTDEHYNEVRDM